MGCNHSQEFQKSILKCAILNILYNSRTNLSCWLHSDFEKSYPVFSIVNTCSDKSSRKNSYIHLNITIESYYSFHPESVFKHIQRVNLLLTHHSKNLSSVCHLNFQTYLVSLLGQGLWEVQNETGSYLL